MNAKEFAHELEKAASFIRQQQAEIEALRKSHIELERGIVKDLNQRQMNNEPVAWMSQGGDVTRSKDYFKEMGFKDLIPLYTHPAKTLTIEEITEVSKEIFKGYKNFYHYQIDFARAILREAQEK